MAASSHRRPVDAPVGRESEATRLASSIDDSAAGAKRAAILLGVPGIGKTTLLRFARTYAEGREIVPSSVRVPATAGLPPRFPLGELLGGFLSAFVARGSPAPERLRRVVATLTGATSVDEYAVSLPQIADALEEAGRLGPLGLFVDDYDWAPSEGTELLMAALRVIETPIFFCASARLRGAADEAPSPLPAPTADLWIDHIEVRGLDPPAVKRLAHSALGCEVLPSLADALFARTLGNPLYIAEALQAWRDDGALVPMGGFLGLAEDADPGDCGSMRDMISSRLARLSEDALTAAGALAVIGREAAFDEIGAASGVREDGLVTPLSVLVREGFVASEGQPAPRYRIAHPLYAAALLDHLGATRVAALHGRICEGLRSTATATELAHHAVRSLHRPADLRVLLASAAAEAEGAGSYDQAAEWYGHIAEAADDPAELVRALTGQATSTIRSDPVRAIELFTYALGLGDSPAARARLLLGRARAHRIAGMVEPAMSDLQEALPLADPAGSFDVRHAIGVMHGVRGRLEDAESVFRALAAESEGTSAHWKAVGHLGMVALTRGAILEGARLHEQAFHRTDDPAYALYLKTNLCWLLLLLGRWDEAGALMRSGLETAIAAGNIDDETSLSCMTARLAAWRGDLAASFDSAQRAIRLATRLGNPADIINAHDALGCALLENDMPGEAIAVMSKILELDREDIEPREYSYTYVIIGECGLLIGDLARARASLARAREHLHNARFWEVAVDRLQAQIELSLGDAVGAFEIVRRYLDAPTSIPFEQARAHEVAAQTLMAMGDRADGLRRAQEALRIYEGLGAARRATRLGAWLVEHTSRGRGRPRSTLPGRLTHREMEILRLIVLGRTNREIAAELYISLGTAKKHVENIMSKAGVSRRTELVPFAVGIGALAVEDLQPRAARIGPRIVRLDVLERSDDAMTDLDTPSPSNFVRLSPVPPKGAVREDRPGSGGP